MKRVSVVAFAVVEVATRRASRGLHRQSVGRKIELSDEDCDLQVELADTGSRC